MDSENKEIDVYGLVTQLCKHLLDKHTPEQHPYLLKKDNSGVLKKLRGKAFAILLNKSGRKYEDTGCRDTDPIVELLKYSFVLKTALRRRSRAEELESSLDRLCETDRDLDPSVYSTLQFLNGLKSFETKDENVLEIFHYGKQNPLLPEEIQDPKEVPRYQIYPMEAFVVPERFEAMLGTDRDCLIGDKSRDRPSNLSFGSQFRSGATICIESLGSRSERTIGTTLSAPKYTVRLVSTREFSTSFFNMPQITEDIDEREDEYSTGHIGLIPEPEPPWLCVKSVRQDCETNSEVSDARLTNIDFNEKPENIDDSTLAIWDNFHDSVDIPEHRTWEKLGRLEVPKESPFISETEDAIFHLERIKQAGFLTLLSRNIVESLNMITEVSTKEFIESIKLLLLGVESKTFTWKNTIGFILRENTIIPGLGVEALKSACSDVVYWGTCYRLLSILIKPDPQTGKMQQEGLIFRAMCNSVKELLLYYQAVILRISVENENSRGLLKLLKNVTPVGSLIAEIARLCRCDCENPGSLGEGLGLLSHIYEQVTQITKPQVALVFYSILKSCCEVYFRFLQKWLFEGTCDDAYGEFMIKYRSQYVRDKGHRFWTKAFAVNTKSVPGFLSNLADLILQCGKTVRLLKICDPKNPLCTMFATSHPTVRVCLSVGMVREQEIICRDFFEKGDKLLGQNVSFSFAFEEERIAEKEKAQLVINAQRDTLLRLKREHEEAKIEIARGKRELLAQLKDQAEEVASRKKRERTAELLKDKLYLESINAAEEIARNAELAEKKNVLDYYNELAADVERRRVRADWRERRMKLLQQREDLINRAKEESCEDEKNVTAVRSSAPTPETENADLREGNIADESNDPVVTRDEPRDAKTEKLENLVVIEDENRNPTEPRNCDDADEIGAVREPEAPDPIADSGEFNVENIEAKAEIPKKSPRPCVLDINRTRMMSGSVMSNLNNFRESLEICNKNLSDRPQELELITADNRKAAQINKLKVLQQEYGMTPNNNELNIIVVDAEGNKNTICIDTATVNPDNLRKATEAETDRNRNRNTRHQTDFWTSEELARVVEDDEHLTDAQKNRNKNIAHYSEESESTNRTNEIDGTENLTDAQKNRKRNMTHTYRDELPDPGNRVNNADFTDLKRNRARMMGHDNRNYQDYVPEDSEMGSNCLDPLTPLSQAPDDFNGVTPMSCTTDTFPLSVSSSLTQFQNCEDDFFMESKNGMRSTTTPGDMISEDPLESRPNSRGFNFPGNSQTFPNFFGLDAAAAPTFESSLTVADVEMIDNTSLQVYLEKSIAIPLVIQSRLANAAIIKYFLYEHKMLSHLHSLRSFYFLLNGEFAKSLTGSLYKRLYEASMPIELFNSVTLTNLLETALNSSLSNTYANSKLLSLSVMEVPLQLQVSNPEALDSLCLNYKISWPLNIILDETLMQQYSKVFKFLLMVGRVLYVLQEDFHILKVERKAEKSDQYHKLQLYRHSMMQFITALHNYLTCSVLHASWAEFEKDLENATTLDQIYLTHVSYVRKILSRCMLTARGEKMRSFLCKVFKVILKFHNRVRSQNWASSDSGYSHANFERLEEMYQAFCKLRTYLAHVANKLASSGYQPHLTHFLNALNINPLYDFTDKEAAKKS